jgi:GGDEF domain-containing protein
MRRKELEDVIRERAEQGETFCLTVAWLSNLAVLFTRFAPDVVLEVMNRVAGRLDGALGGNPFWAKWDDDCYVALMPLPKADANRTSQAAAARLSGVYPITHQGATHEPNIKVTVGVIERNKNEGGDKLIARLGMLLKTLRATH